MVLGWHCTKGPASATALCIVCILEHSVQSNGSSNSAECITQSVAIPAVSTRRVPSCILTGQQFTVTEASLKGKGGLGIGQDAMEVLRGGHLNISSCIMEFLKNLHQNLLLHGITTIVSFIACMYQPSAYYAPPFSSTRDDYSMSTPVTKQPAWTEQLYSS